MRSVIHQGLLQTDAGTEALVVADSPGVAVDLVHLLRRNADNATLLDNFRVFATDVFDGLEVFHGDERLYTGGVCPLLNFASFRVDDAIVHLAISANDDDVGLPLWARSVVWTSQPLHHLCLGRFEESDGIVVQLAIFGSEDRDGCFDFRESQRIQGMSGTSSIRYLLSQLLYTLENHCDSDLNEEITGNRVSPC